MDLFNISDIEFNSWREEQLKSLNKFEEISSEIVKFHIKRKGNIFDKITELQDKKKNLRPLLLEDLIIIKKNNEDLKKQTTQFDNKIEELNEKFRLKSQSVKLLRKEKEDAEKRSLYLQKNMLNLLNIHIKTLKLYQLLDLDIEIKDNEEVRLYFVKFTKENYYLQFSSENEDWILLNSNPLHPKLEEISRYFKETQDTKGLITFFNSFIKKNVSISSA